MKYFLIHDTDKTKGCICLDDECAKSEKVKRCADYNVNGWGVFWSVNLPDSAMENGKTVRRSEFVKDSDINAWFVDIDTDSKDDSFLRILNSPIVPSKVIESKGGFHVYFKVKDKTATVSNFKIIQKRLITLFAGDKKCTDIVRLLRVPGYFNNKDVNNPFRVEIIHDSKEDYTEDDMLEYLPKSEDERKQERVIVDVAKFKEINPGLNDFFKRLEEANQKELLEGISGSVMVNGSRFDFKPTSNGKFNFIINDKDHGFFINEKGHIITIDGYSNNVFNFLKWYGHSNKEIYSFLKDII
jgi:hypothetical protein